MERHCKHVRQLNAGCTPARLRVLSVVGLFSAGAVCAQLSVDLTMAQNVFIAGEAIRVDVSMVNHATTPFRITPEDEQRNAIFFEVKDSHREVLESTQPRTPLIPQLNLPPGETYRAAFELDEWYPMGRPGSYIVTAMVRRGDHRFDSVSRAFDVVPGLEIKTAIQLFADRPDLQRKLTLVYFMRKQSEFLFLRITDTPGERTWSTLELGQLLRTTPVSIEVSPDGVATICHRATQDVYLRTQVRSTVRGVELIGQEQIVDQRSAALQAQMRALDASLKKKKSSSWWPFSSSDDSK